MRVRTVVLGFFCLIVYTRRQNSVIITETRVLAQKLLYYHAKVDTIRQNPYTNTETACEFSCSYKGFRDSVKSFRDNIVVLRDSIQKNRKMIARKKGCSMALFWVWIFLIHFSVITSTLSKNDGAFYIYLS